MKQRRSNAPRLASKRARVGASAARRPAWLICSVLIVVLLLLAGSSLWPGGMRRARSASKNAPARRAPERASVQNSEDGLWRESGRRVAARAGQPERPGQPDSYRTLNLDSAVLVGQLRRAPTEGTAAARTEQVLMSLPVPDGTFARFRVVESPIMEPALAARFPELKTYSAQGVDDPAATARFDWTPEGLHAIILSPHGTAYVEPDGAKGRDSYRAYDHRDLAAQDATLQCDVTEAEQSAATERAASATHRHGSGQPSPLVSSGAALRTYRLAVAATAEYTNTYGGGTIAGALSAITTTVNLVNAIYQRDAAIRLVLVANADAVIYTNAATDPYTSDNVGAMIGQNQTNLDAVIGPNNYDIGHVFDGRQLSGGFSFRGVASIASVCVAGLKGRGATALRSVQPSSVIAYYIVAHEMGHQFSATHTFNATTPECGDARYGPTAYEPGSGSTIMAYRFNCGGEDLRSSDTYFHIASLEQIVNYVSNGNGACATPTATNNNPPTIDAGPAYTIPQGTPFTLTATGGDSEGDALTYCWEQFDLGAAGPPHTDDGSRPLFRSFAPTTERARTFPRLTDVLSNTVTFGESLPTTTRIMNFRVTARDNRADGGGIASAATQLNVRADAGPFVVTSPTVGTSWSGRLRQVVMWNVANTSSAPVGAAGVRISLSTDGGFTYPYVLADNTPNDGAEDVTLPNPTSTSSARIKVEAVGNVFFNVSRPFSLSHNPCPFTLNPTGLSVPAGGGNFTVNVTTDSGCGWSVNNTTPWIAVFNTEGGGTGSGSVLLAVAANPSSFVRGGTLIIAGYPFNVTQSGLPPASARVQFGEAVYSSGEGEGRAVITVTRTGEDAGPASVEYRTEDDPAVVRCDTTNGTAYARCDYATTIDRVTFAAGDFQPKTITVPLIDDAHVENDEFVRLRLSNPQGAALIGNQSTTTLIIRDNDTSPAATNPVLSSPFFVRMQYLDFLSREPEPDGLNAWLNVLNNCSDVNNNPACDRLTVSSSFFRSQEFQLKGYFVYLFYRTSLNRRPQYEEIIPDMRAVTGQTPAEVFQKRAQFAEAWSHRPEFVARYGSLSNAAYVEALLGRYGLSQITTPDPANPDGTQRVTLTRNDLVNRLGVAGALALTRAQVLRAIVQSQEIDQIEYNGAFVAMQYYGYLRRTPEEEGYQSWLRYLNTNPSDFRTMVNGFMNSQEYRLRFGSVQ